MAITFSGTGPDGKRREPGVRDPYHQAEVGVGPAARAVGAGVRELADAYPGRVRTATNAIGGMQGAARGAVAAGGLAAMNNLTAPARAAGYLGGELRAGFNGSPSPGANPQPMAGGASTGLSRPFAGVGAATGAAAAGVRASGLARPMPTGFPAAASGTMTGAARSPVAMPSPANMGPPQAMASLSRPMPGDPNTFTGANGQVRQMTANGITGAGSNPAGSFSGGVSDPRATAADTRTNYGVPSLARPMPGQAAPQASLTRPTPNPAGQAAAILDPRSAGFEMLRRAQNASSDFQLRGSNRTRAQREAILAGQAPERNFWLDQAASIGGNAQARFQQAQALRSQEAQANAGNATSLQGVQATNDARLAAEQMQQQGAMDRTQAGIAAELRRPQPPIQLADGTLVQIGPDGALVPYQLPDGSTARGFQRPQRDYGAEAETRLMGQLISAQRDPITGALASNAGQLAREQLQQFRNGGAPTAAITALRGNPNLAADFDAKYGQGMAARYLASN